MGHYVKKFAVYDNGTEVFRGTAIEIENWNDMLTRDKVYAYVYSQRTMFGRYTIKQVESVWSEKKDPPKKKEKTKEQKHRETLDWIKFALMQPPEYKTSYHTDGREFKNELEAHGITFEAEKHPYEKKVWYLKRTWTTKHSQQTSNA